MVGRDAYEVMARALGGAYLAITTPYGDTIKNPGAMLAIEEILCKLREATLFHNDDYVTSLDTGDGLYTPRFLVFNTPDPVGFGIQGGSLDMIAASAFPFSQSGSWTPDFGPFCPEGWGIYDYNAWKAWPVPEPSPGYEGGNYNTRLTYNYPVQYDGGGAYSRVAYWERGRWISFLNNTGDAITSGEVVVFLSDAELEGIQILRPDSAISDEVPMDVRAYAHPNLIQSYVGTTWGTIVSPASAFDDLAMKWETADGGWNLVLSIPVDNPNSPPRYDWPVGYYWHVLLYWGSRDTQALSVNPFSAYTSGQRFDVSSILWTTKSFFRTDVNTQLQWTPRGIVDGSAGYLVAQERTHFTFQDATFVDPTVPTKYALQPIPRALPVGVANSLTGYTPDIPFGCAAPITICATTSGDLNTTAQATMQVLAGPIVPPELWPLDWRGFYAFPSAPADYVTIAQVVLVRAPAPAYKIAELRERDLGIDTDLLQSNALEIQTIYCTTAIEEIDWIAKPYALPPIGSMRLSQTVLPTLVRATERLRQYLTNNPVLTAAYSLLVPQARVPTDIAPNQQGMSDPTSLASRVFLGLLKYPSDPLLIPGDGAISFDAGSAAVVGALAGKDPCVNLGVLDVNNLYLTGRTLDTPGPLEIYFNPTDQCTIVDPNGAGESLGLDYTFRLILEDQSENLFTKDWYIMASKFFVTSAQYQQMIALGQDTDGYFTQSTLSNIPEYALFGTTGVVPDLTMGQSQELVMRLEEIVNIDDNGNQTITLGTNRYPNSFVSLRSMRLCITSYAFFDTPYWTINLNGFWGALHGGVDNFNGTNATDPQDARADSFTIALSGLSAGALEGHDSSSPVNIDSGLNHSSNTGTDILMSGVVMAASFTTTSNTTVSGFNLELKSVLAATNTTGFLENPIGIGLACSIWSDSNGPYNEINAGSSVDYVDIVAGEFNTYRFTIDQEFHAGIKYWLIITQMAPAIGGYVVFNAESDGSPVLLQYDPTADNWVTPGGYAWLTASNGSSVVLSPTFDATSTVGFDEPMLYGLAAANLTVSGTFNSFSVRLKSTAQLTNITGKTITVKLCQNNNGVPGTVVQTFTLPLMLLTTAYQAFSFTTTSPQSAGVYWVTLSLAPTTGGYVCLHKDGTPGTDLLTQLTSTSSFTPLVGQIYAQFFDVPVQIYGAFNRDSTDVDGSLPGPFDGRTYIGPNQQSAIYKVDSWWAFNCDEIVPAAPLSIYPRAFINPITSGWQYANFSQNCYVLVRYVQNGIIQTQNITIPSAPGWLGQFWDATSSDYQSIDENQSPTLTEILSKLDLLNYSAQGALAPYFNAVFTGSFAPWFADSYQITVVCEGGCRLYFDGSPTPSMDSWILGGSPPDFYTPILVAGQQYTIRVEYYCAGGAQQLFVLWQSLRQLSGFLGPDTAQVPSPAPIQIGSGDISSVCYVSVGKTFADVNTYTFGAPPGDNLIIRSA